MEFRIFISHSSKDRLTAESIHSLATSQGITAYIFEHDPQPGRLLAAKIEDAIKASDAVILLLTRNSATSQFVHQEVGVALANRKLIVPLVEPGLAQSALAMLQGVEYILFDYHSPQEAMVSLTRALHKYREEHRLSREQQERVERLLLVVALVGLVILFSMSAQS